MNNGNLYNDPLLAALEAQVIPENPNAWLYRRYYGPDATMKLASLNLQVTMADIYQDLHFDQKEEEDDEL